MGVIHKKRFVMPFGKYKGSELKDLSYRYLEWCAENLEPSMLRTKLENELNRRDPEEGEYEDLDRAEEFGDYFSWRG